MHMCAACVPLLACAHLIFVSHVKAALTFLVAHPTLCELFVDVTMAAELCGLLERNPSSNICSIGFNNDLITRDGAVALASLIAAQTHKVQSLIFAAL